MPGVLHRRTIQQLKNVGQNLLSHIIWITLLLVFQKFEVINIGSILRKRQYLLLTRQRNVTEQGAEF